MNDIDIKHPTHPIAIDPYKAPELRAAADHSLAALRNLLRDAVSNINVREIETKESA